ncbi:MAG: hypothetical protein ACRD28_02130 [Acidobacteriaceae bacterium]
MIHNYTAHDLLATAAIVPVFAIFLVFPGYGVGWLTDLLQFRSSSTTRRILLSLPLSLAISTIVVNLVGRYVRPAIILWAFLIAGALVSFHWIYVWTRRKPRVSRAAKSTKVALILAGLWTVIVIGSLADIEIGNKLYASTALWDHAVRIAFVHSALRSMPPVRNPFSYLGSAPVARYYYYWYVLCSYPARLTHFNPRYALYGSSVWCGFLLAAMIPLYLQDFFGIAENLRRKSVIGIALLSVTGLDILPTIYEFLRARTVSPDMEWWDPVQITSWTDALIWVPHHVAALVACLIGFLALWNVRKIVDKPYSVWIKRTVCGTFAAFAFAAAAGLSIYVTFTFALFLLCWGIRLLYKRVYQEFVLYLGTACLTFLISVPYLHDLLPHQASNASPAVGGAAVAGIGAGPFAFGLRALPSFLATPYFLKIRGFSHPWLFAPAGVIVVYILEFGVFALIAWDRFERDRNRQSKLDEAEIAAWYMVAVGMFVITFVRSSVISSNDLAFRSAMIPQFIFLLWGAEYFDRWCFVPHPDRWKRGRMKNGVILSTLALGFVATCYSLTILRTYMLFDDSGMIVYPADWLPAPHEIGIDLMHVRQAYAQLDKILPPRSIVQYNPMRNDYLPLLEYDKFQSVDAFPNCGTEFGGDASKCPPVQTAIDTLFNKPGEVNIREVCAQLSIDVLVVRQDDPAWQDRKSWVWTNSPVVEDSYIRAFRCQ